VLYQEKYSFFILGVTYTEVLAIA